MNVLKQRFTNVWWQIAYAKERYIEGHGIEPSMVLLGRKQEREILNEVERFGGAILATADQSKIMGLEAYVVNRDDMVKVAA